MLPRGSLGMTAADSLPEEKVKLPKPGGDTMEIKTERLILRPVQIGDEEEIHDYTGDKSDSRCDEAFWIIYWRNL